MPATGADKASIRTEAAARIFLLLIRFIFSIGKIELVPPAYTRAHFENAKKRAETS